MALPLSRRAALFALGSTVLLGSCTIASDGKNTPDNASASEGSLKTVTPGKLTIATGEPAYSPVGGEQRSRVRQGFRGRRRLRRRGKTRFRQRGRGVGAQHLRCRGRSRRQGLGLQPAAVLHHRGAPERRRFLLPLLHHRAGRGDPEGFPGIRATTVAELKSALLGAQTGTTSHRMLTETVAPTTAPSVFNNSQDTVQALKGGQVDAIVVDLPTALYLVAAELDGGVVVGQFADTSGGDQFGLVLPKGSALTAAVTGAVDALRADGTLDSLTKTWLSETVNVPVLS